MYSATVADGFIILFSSCKQKQTSALFQNISFPKMY